MALPEWLKKLATYGSVLRSYDGEAKEMLAPNGGSIGLVAADVSVNGVSQNRVINAQTTHPSDDTTNVATWTKGENIHYLIIPPNCRFIVNAISAAAAKSDLEATANISQTVLHGRTYGESMLYAQKTPITRLDIVKTDATDTALNIIARS